MVGDVEMVDASRLTFHNRRSYREAFPVEPIPRNLVSNIPPDALVPYGPVAGPAYEVVDEDYNML